MFYVYYAVVRRSWAKAQTPMPRRLSSRADVLTRYV